MVSGGMLEIVCAQTLCAFAAFVQSASTPTSTQQPPVSVPWFACLQAGPVQTPAAVAAATAAGYDVQQQEQPQQSQQQQPRHKSLQELQCVYRTFLENTLVKEFHRISRSLPDIQTQVAALWPRYLSGAAGPKQQQQHLQDDMEVGGCGMRWLLGG